MTGNVPCAIPDVINQLPSAGVVVLGAPFYHPPPWRGTAKKGTTYEPNYKKNPTATPE